ncbi:MAG: MCE family protein [Candidatus Omnitrophica bacterium]|nr:MCE family protein [Candidatus Omnitrophota bacterium]
MVMKRRNLELRVGLFVFVALGLLAALVFKAGDFYLKPGYTLRFIFNFVSGVDAGSPVRLAGVNVGEVKSIRVIRSEAGETQAEIIAWIAQDIHIEEDAEVRINSLGLIGEKYVEILPGTSGAKTLSDGGVLAGKAPVVLEKLTESGARLVRKLEETVDHINEVVSDPEFRTAVKDTFTKASGTFSEAEIFSRNLVGATEDLKEAAKSAKVILARLRDGEGSIGRLLKDETLAKDLEAFAKEIKVHPWRLLKRD